MDWEKYSKEFKQQAKCNYWTDNQIELALDYAKKLNDRNLPIIYDQNHLCLLLGWQSKYVHAMSNVKPYFYRQFKIPKKKGGFRTISEPLPDLKQIQKWILNNILYKVPCSKFAKAYVVGGKLKSNAKFHKGQNAVLKLDIKSFFDSIKETKIVGMFMGFGYIKSVAVMLAKLCCYAGCLPQGAPTSPYLSNLFMLSFDDVISDYCVQRKIRYTRYADDLTFSGDFDREEIISVVIKELKKLGLKLNMDKTCFLRQNSRQCVTGIVVNAKLQAPRDYRMSIRQDVYYIRKYSLEDHLHFLDVQQRNRYLYSLLGKISYVLSINNNDKQMLAYREFIGGLLNK